MRWMQRRVLPWEPPGRKDEDSSANQTLLSGVGFRVHPESAPALRVLPAASADVARSDRVGLFGGGEGAVEELGRVVRRGKARGELPLGRITRGPTPCEQLRSGCPSPPDPDRSLQVSIWSSSSSAWAIGPMAV